jgi:purine nucleosidase
LLKKKVILDVDSGIDDVIAIIAALRSTDIDVVGISVVSGNVSTSTGLLNVRKVLELADRADVLVFKGSNNSMTNRSLPTGIKRRRQISHGKGGLGDFCIDRPKLESELQRAMPRELKMANNYLNFIDFIMKTCGSNELSIIATGPLTNIATAIKHEPSFIDSVKEICIMGGAFGLNTHKTFGNVTKHAEFNFYCDPEAAQILLNTKMKAKIKIAGLDITLSSKCAIDKEFVNTISNHKKNSRDFLSEYKRFILSLLEFKLSNSELIHLHDVIAVIMLERPSLFRFKTGNIEVCTSSRRLRGHSIFKENEQSGNISVAVDIDEHKFKTLLLQRLLF